MSEEIKRTGDRLTEEICEERRRKGVEAFNERQESEAGGNRGNNKKWTERKEPTGSRRRRKSGERVGGRGGVEERRLWYLVNYWRENTLQRLTRFGEHREGLYVLMYSLIGLSLSASLLAAPSFNPTRSSRIILREIYADGILYTMYSVCSRFVDEYHLYWRDEKEGRSRRRCASGNYRSVINIVSLTGEGIRITLPLLSRGDSLQTPP